MLNMEIPGQNLCSGQSSLFGFRQLTVVSHSAKSIFIHPVDYTPGWQGCSCGTKARALQVGDVSAEHEKQWNTVHIFRKHFIFF